jgi:hypothetical protein
MIQTSKTTPPMKVIESLDDLPDFRNEAEEAEFWATHELGGAALEKMGALDDVLGPPDSSRVPPER